MKDGFFKMLFSIGTLTFLFPALPSLWAQASDTPPGLWSRLTADNEFKNPQNWVDGVVPDSPYFNESRQSTLDFGTGVIVANFTVTLLRPFYDPPTVFTFGAGAIGSQVLTLKDGGNIEATALFLDIQTFNSKIVLGETGGPGTYSIGGSVRINGPISGGVGGSEGNKTLTLASEAAVDFRIHGEISNGGASSLGVILASSSGVPIYVFHAKNTYTGDTVLEVNTILKLATDFAISQLSDVTMQRGSMLSFDGGDQHFGQLSLAGPPPFSPFGDEVILDFGFGSGLSAEASFADSHDLEWMYKLALGNFDIGLDTLRFGTSDTALTDEQLSMIYLPGYAADLDQNGYVVFTAIPEPHTIGLFVLGFLVAGAASLAQSRRLSSRGTSKIA